MSEFIEVTGIGTNTPHIIQVSHIIAVSPDEDGDVCIYTSGLIITCKESLDIVRQLIRKAKGRINAS